MSTSFDEVVRPLLCSLLGPDEELRGIIAATHQRTFSGSLYAIGVTDRRLVLQRLDRKLRAKDPPRVITAETLASADVDGAGGGWWTAPMIVLDMAAIALTLGTTDGEKMRFTLMKGGAALAGGPKQTEGIVALAEWIGRSEGPHP
jgi:hypothetical protein